MYERKYKSHLVEGGFVNESYHCHLSGVINYSGGKGLGALAEL